MRSLSCKVIELPSGMPQTSSTSMEELPRLLCTAQRALHFQSHRVAVRSPDDFVVSCCRSLPLRYFLSVHIASIVRFGQSLEECYKHCAILCFDTEMLHKSKAALPIKHALSTSLSISASLSLSFYAVQRCVHFIHSLHNYPSTRHPLPMGEGEEQRTPKQSTQSRPAG
ncbi:unnamed protein product, partial [Hydatigera taeniaeformis]|uniref:Uncharacterized protein n=1 Tax=Hydatigena taeniaeformis TaxID=6205 RepID=A0A0R3WPR8_HYDTA